MRLMLQIKSVIGFIMGDVYMPPIGHIFILRKLFLVLSVFH